MIKNMEESPSDRNAAHNVTACGVDSLMRSNSCVGQWEACLRVCHDVISSTNVLLSNIGSSAVCREVVYSCRGQRYIQDLGAVYGVSRRIRSEIQRLLERGETLVDENKQLEGLTKQIELAWNNMLAFCPNTPLEDFDIMAEGGDDSAVCGVCCQHLRATDDNQVYHEERVYHLTCANLWINTVDPLSLPTAD